jgi:signal transduction histidine kinase
MISSSTKRKVLIGNSIILFWIIMTIFSDVASVNPEVISWFYLSKAVLLVASVALNIMALRNEYHNIDPNKFYLILAAAYCVLGEVFCPGYHLAYIQVVALAMLIFDVSKRFIMAYLSVFTATYFTTFTWLNFNKVGVSGYESYFFDIQAAIILVSILSLGMYFYVLKFKQEKEYFSKKYEFLGKNMSSKIHELKAELLAPTISLDQLINYSDRYTKDEQREILVEVQEQMSKLKESLKKANEFSNIDTELVNVKQIVETYAQQFRLANFKYYGQASLTGSKEKIDVILRNALKNAVENSDRNVPVVVEVKGQSITIQDQGGGFPREILPKLNEGIPVSSEKKDGNGVGLASIHNLVQQMNGSIKFFNKDDRACIKIII